MSRYYMHVQIFYLCIGNNGEVPWMASTPPHKAVGWMPTYAEVCYIDPLHVNSMLTYADLCFIDADVCRRMLYQPAARQQYADVYRRILLT